MTTAETAAGRTPWHFWIVAILAVLWNGFGGVDYTLSHLQGEPWYRIMGMTDAQIALMDTYPSWTHAVWAIGVWASVAGTILLLLRRRWAFHAFALSTLGAIGSVIYTASNAEAQQVMGVSMLVIVTAICLFFVWYSRLMTKQGVLR